MESLKVETAVEKIRVYLRRDTLRPYFVIADDAAAIEELKKHFGGVEQINVSGFCTSGGLLDTDELVDRLKSVETRALVLGLGEYIYRTGRENVLRALQDRSFNGKIIFVCRGIANTLERLADGDAKFRANRICRLEGKASFNDLRPSKVRATNTSRDAFEEAEAHSPTSDYLTDYDFGDEAITNYFCRYKQIKLLNVDDEEFKAHVRSIALDRPYNKFETRAAILDRADRNAKLYWLDALGVEFLGYIKARAERSGLVVDIKIARAELPTLTSLNRSFYDDWSGEKFNKNSALDTLKHSPEAFGADGRCSDPICIDNELNIIDKAMDEIKSDLVNRRAAKIILTSDHGASRLAVMFGRENKFKMSSVGEHGGRCCRTNELDEKPDCAIEENGYWVSANYDRFAGGRLASIEVHGGATLEEILVPVIEISLQGASGAVKKTDAGFEFFDE